MTLRLLLPMALVCLMAGTLSGCEMVKKVGQVIANPSIKVGDSVDQPSEIAITLLTEPDTNPNESGDASPVSIQLIYMSEDSKLRNADFDLITSTKLDEALGKNYIDHQDFTLLPDTMKTLPLIKMDPAIRYIGVVAYFSDDQTTEWKAITSVEKIGHHYRLLVHVRDSSIELKKEDQ
ncbi:type VI secretion system lipoprotein TssJ [Buttiauxella gaviniae]|uniref:Type VI secretion system lipoprotein TssJ n=1 Tax=Buttiauxella gaviniae TaxID=82990 RepID=A0ABV3NP84_9ENTR